MPAISKGLFCRLPDAWRIKPASLAAQRLKLSLIEHRWYRSSRPSRFAETGQMVRATTSTAAPAIPRLRYRPDNHSAYSAAATAGRHGAPLGYAGFGRRSGLSKPHCAYGDASGSRERQPECFPEFRFMPGIEERRPEPEAQLRYQAIRGVHM